MALISHISHTSSLNYCFWWTVTTPCTSVLVTLSSTFTLKMAVADSSDILVITYRTTRRHNPEDHWTFTAVNCFVNSEIVTLSLNTHYQDCFTFFFVLFWARLFSAALQIWQHSPCVIPVCRLVQSFPSNVPRSSRTLPSNVHTGCLSVLCPWYCWNHNWS